MEISSRYTDIRLKLLPLLDSIDHAEYLKFSDHIWMRYQRMMPPGAQPVRREDSLNGLMGIFMGIYGSAGQDLKAGRIKFLTTYRINLLSSMPIHIKWYLASVLKDQQHKTHGQIKRATINGRCARCNETG